MRAKFNPDGTGKIEYCPRCEQAALEKLRRFQCVQGSGLLIDPRLHPMCAARVKPEIAAKISKVWAALNEANPLASVVAATSGIQL